MNLNWMDSGNVGVAGSTKVFEANFTAADGTDIMSYTPDVGSIVTGLSYLNQLGILANANMDIDSNMLTRPTGNTNGPAILVPQLKMHYQFILKSDATLGSVNRWNFVFRGTNAATNAEYMVAVHMDANPSITLRDVAATGIASYNETFAGSGTYTIDVYDKQTTIEVWVNGVKRIDHTLSPSNGEANRYCGISAASNDTTPFTRGIDYLLVETI